MQRPPLGKLELEVFRYISDHPLISVGEAVEQFAAPRGLARTTVSTVMENLRKKSYLTRKMQAGVFRYSARVGQAEVLRGLVEDFVDSTLAGSVSPFVAYLAEANDLSDEEIDALRKLLGEVSDRKEREAP